MIAFKKLLLSPLIMKRHANVLFTFVFVVSRMVNDAVFQAQLFALADLGRPFVAATYDLEGDGFLSIYAYDKVQALLNMPTNYVHPRPDDFLVRLMAALPAGGAVPPAAVRAAFLDTHV